MAKVTKEQIERNIQDITDTFDRKISEVRNDGLAPESVKEIKINELEKKKK
jgi:restriction endonuclease S subunit